jgi:hypothetical protein
MSIVDGWRGKHPESYHTGATNNKAFPQYMEKLAEMDKGAILFANFKFPCLLILLNNLIEF